MCSGMYSIPIIVTDFFWDEMSYFTPFALFLCCFNFTSQKACRTESRKFSTLGKSNVHFKGDLFTAISSYDNKHTDSSMFYKEICVISVLCEEQNKMFPYL